MSLGTLYRAKRLNYLRPEHEHARATGRELKLRLRLDNDRTDRLHLRQRTNRTLNGVRPDRRPAQNEGKELFNSPRSAPSPIPTPCSMETFSTDGGCLPAYRLSTALRPHHALRRFRQYNWDAPGHSAIAF